MAEPIAHELAKKQREIGIAEFFAKNKHLLGFDNPKKALLTCVKEAVDNSLDACEEADILPDIAVQLIDMGENRFKIIVEDNGPGIVKSQIPNVFGKLLYGSKFHSRKQQRGQQGIGISAAVMYAQLTTGRAAKILSKIHPDKPTHYYELFIDTKTNSPHIIKDEEREWNKNHGTKIEIDIEGNYQKGPQSVDEYLKQTAIVNPHLSLVYVNPKAEQYVFTRVSEQFPKKSKEILPHPYGVELGILLKMLQETKAKSLQQFLSTEFSRVSINTAKEICENARLPPNLKPKDISMDGAEHLIKGFHSTKIMSPSTDCLSPIGEELLEKGLRKEINAEFYIAITRPPVVYKGNPFQVEIALAYGGEQLADKQAKVIRFANKVPLLYQQGDCAITKAITSVDWKAYGLEQSSNSLPSGPLTIAVHIASVWIPFTSESKEAIAHYEDIIKEIRLALQDAGRQLGKYLSKKRRIHAEIKKRGFIEKYIPRLATTIGDVLQLNKSKVEEMEIDLREILEKHRGEIENIEEENPEYDEEFAKIGEGDEDKREETD